MSTAPLVHRDELGSVGSRVSWGAILAGGMVALGTYFLLATLGGAVGLSISDRTSADTMQLSTVIWVIVSTMAATFIGGVVTSMLTLGEDQREALVYGMVMWAFLFTVLSTYAVAGASTGLLAMANLARGDAHGMTINWEQAARDAGVPASEIEEWRQKAHGQTPASRETTTDASRMETARKIGWTAFAGTWLSMMSAAAGAWFGAGPVLRGRTFTTTRSVLS